MFRLLASRSGARHSESCQGVIVRRGLPLRKVQPLSGASPLPQKYATRLCDDSCGWNNSLKRVPLMSEPYFTTGMSDQRVV